MIAFAQDVKLVCCINDIMLIGPGEREVATTLDILVRHIREHRKQIPQNSGVCHRGEISRGPVVWDILRYPFQDERQVSISVPFYHQERSTRLSEPLRIWEAKCISFGHAVLTYLLSDPKGYQVSVGPGTSESSAASPGYSAALPFGPCDPEDLVVLEVSVEHRDLCGDFGKPP